MGTKLYVGNLSYNITNEQLAQHFSQIGKVSEAIIILDKETRKSKGFGFVTFSTEDDTRTAIETLNETEFMGRKLIVNEARPQVPRDYR